MSELATLTADTKLDTGLSVAAGTPEFNKQSALRDLKALSDAALVFPNLAKTEAAEIVSALVTLESDPTLYASLRRRPLIEKGLDLLDGPDCPLCDHPWGNEQHLREHLKAKLSKSDDARKLQQALLDNGASLAREARGLASLLALVQKVAAELNGAAFAELLGKWRTDLDGLQTKLGNVDGITSLKQRLQEGWPKAPKTFSSGLKALRDKTETKPDQMTTLDAQTFLTTAQLRLSDYRSAMRENKAAEIASKAATAAYDIYCSVMEEELNALYDDVQADFSTFYKTINEEDEVKFTAKLTPSAGKLDFDVNFYERGLFPPGAYHSEGHQDSMGVCLYLALMKRLFGDQFTFALLDDVVMSVTGPSHSLDGQFYFQVPGDRLQRPARTG